MTGRYPVRTGMQHAVIGTPDNPWGLPTNESTWAEGMRLLGYKTHIVGKWHLGLYQNASLPTSRGFDEHFGYLSGEEDYWTHSVSWQGGAGACASDSFASSCVSDLQASGASCGARDDAPRSYARARETPSVCASFCEFRGHTHTRTQARWCGRRTARTAPFSSRPRRRRSCERTRARPRRSFSTSRSSERTATVYR